MARDATATQGHPTDMEFDVDQFRIFLPDSTCLASACSRLSSSTCSCHSAKVSSRWVGSKTKLLRTSSEGFCRLSFSDRPRYLLRRSSQKEKGQVFIPDRFRAMSYRGSKPSSADGENKSQIKGHRCAFWHWGIRRLKELQACGRNDRTK